LSVAMGKLKLNSQWESNPQVKGLYANQTFQSRIERDSLVTSTPLRGATVSNAVLGKLKSSRLRNAGFMPLFGSFSPCLGSVHTSASSNLSLKFRWDGRELNPVISPLY